MASLNKVLLIGNLTRDPELRRTPSGAAVADLRLAVNRKYKTAEGESRDETCYVNVTVWNRQAETCAEYLSKGSPILAEGRLKFDEWEKEGQKQSRLSVVAERVQFLSGPKKSEGGDAPGYPPAGPAAGPAPAPEPQGSASSGDDDNLPF
jgi:single-strand DNA-binding protein